VANGGQPIQTNGLANLLDRLTIDQAKVSHLIEGITAEVGMVTNGEGSMSGEDKVSRFNATLIGSF
jgi:hypothetical protein